ncbi:MAG: DUF4440 domain-containing protein [Saprospiraceae bacterium]|nr:DUF4440 domain-containing protein [Lewinella sp.]
MKTQLSTNTLWQDTPKHVLLHLLLLLPLPFFAQIAAVQDYEQAITTLIAQYAQARETQDTVLLKNILTKDIDQLVSTGEWRRGIGTAVKGMQRSSGNNPGTRTLTVEHIRLLTPASAIADARYVIEQTDGTQRRMWSTFITVMKNDEWKIAGIRNMLPANR